MTFKYLLIASLGLGFVVPSRYYAIEEKHPEQSAGLHADIEYGQVGDDKLLLDAYVPKGSGPFPVVVLVHGGGWGSGDKQGDITPLLEPLSTAGFTWFSINYRLAPKNHWAACYDDVQMAIQWVRAHAAEYQGDPKCVAVIGYSAGGQLVCLSAVRATEATRVQAIVGCAAPTDLPADTERRGGLSKSLQDLLDRPQVVNPEVQKILQDLSAINYIKSDLPPFLLIHGNADKSVPYSQSVAFQTKLKEAGVPCDLVTIEGAPHRLSEWEKFDPSYKEKLVAWLKKTLDTKDKNVGSK